MLRAALLSALFSSVLCTKLVGLGVCGQGYDMGFLTDRCYNVESNGEGPGSPSSIMVSEVDMSTKQSAPQLMIQVHLFSDDLCMEPSSSSMIPSAFCHEGALGPNTFWMITDDDCNDFADTAHPVRILESQKFEGVECAAQETSFALLLEADCDHCDDDCDSDENLNQQWTCGQDGSPSLDFHSGDDFMCESDPVRSQTFAPGTCIPSPREEASYHVSCSPFFCPSPPPVPTPAPVLVSIGTCGEGYDRHVLTNRCYNKGPDSQMFAYVNGGSSTPMLLVYLFSGRDCLTTTSTVDGYQVEEGECHPGVNGENTFFTVAQCFMDTSAGFKQSEEEEPPMLQYAEFESFLGSGCQSPIPSSVFGNLVGACEPQDDGSSEMFSCGTTQISKTQFDDDMCSSDSSTTTYLTQYACNPWQDGSSIIPMCLPIMCPAPEAGSTPQTMCHDHDEVLAYFASLYGMESANPEETCKEFATLDMCNDQYYGELVAILCPMSCGQYDQDDELRNLVDQYTSYAGMIDTCARAVAMAQDGCFNNEYGSFLQALCPCSCNEHIMAFIAGEDSDMPPLGENKSAKKATSKLAMSMSDIKQNLESQNNKSAGTFKIKKSFKLPKF